jgi:hypothetical protein
MHQVINMSQMNLNNMSKMNQLRNRKIITNERDIVESTWLNNHPSLGKSDQVVWAYGKVMNDFKYVRINANDIINQRYLQNIDIEYILDKNYDIEHISNPSSLELELDEDTEEEEEEELAGEKIGDEEELDEHELNDEDYDEEDYDDEDLAVWHRRVCHITEDILQEFDDEHELPVELLRDSDRYADAEESGFFGDMTEDGTIMYGSNYDGGYDSY